MAIVKEYNLGGTIVRVHDDAYKNKTKEDIDKIIKRVEAIVSKSISSNYEEEYPITFTRKNSSIDG